MALKNNALRLATATANCDCCFMESHCWPGIEAHSGEVHVKREPTLMPENLLWREAALFNGLYFVRSGAIKVYEIDLSGEERIVQFAFAGDLLGLEALAAGRHENSAVALIETMLCKLPWPPPAADHVLLERLLRRASVQLRQRARATRLADPDASVRSFLHEIATHIGREERVGENVWIRQRLPMSRLEIGQYLGYAEETVCRSMRRLQSNGELEVSGRTLLLRKLPAGSAASAARNAAGSATLSA